MPSGLIPDLSLLGEPGLQPDSDSQLICAACNMEKFNMARKAIMFQEALNWRSAQMNIGAKIAEETKWRG